MKVNDFLEVYEEDILDVYDSEENLGELSVSTLRKYFGNFKVISINNGNYGTIKLTIEEG